MGKGVLRAYRGGREQRGDFSTKEDSSTNFPIDSLKVSNLIGSIRDSIANTDASLLKDTLNELSGIFRIQSDETQESHNRRIMAILDGLKQKDQNQWKEPLVELDYYRNTSGKIVDTKDAPRLIIPSVDLIMREPFSHGGIQISSHYREQSRNHREALLLRIYGIEIWKIPLILNIAK